jgi:hypothetical protein
MEAVDRANEDENFQRVTTNEKGETVMPPLSKE